MGAQLRTDPQPTYHSTLCLYLLSSLQLSNTYMAEHAAFLLTVMLLSNATLGTCSQASTTKSCSTRMCALAKLHLRAAQAGCFLVARANVIQSLSPIRCYQLLA